MQAHVGDLESQVGKLTNKNKNLKRYLHRTRDLLEEVDMEMQFERMRSS